MCDFIDESVDGAAFLDLTEKDVKTMVKALGHVKHVLCLILTLRSKASYARSAPHAPLITTVPYREQLLLVLILNHLHLVFG